MGTRDNPIDPNGFSSGVQKGYDINDDYNGLGQGAKTVTASGTAEALAAADTTGRLVIIKANSANTGVIAIGSSGVVAGTTGYDLAAGEAVILPVPGEDLNNIYIDASVSGEGVKFTYFTSSF